MYDDEQHLKPSKHLRRPSSSHLILETILPNSISSMSEEDSNAKIQNLMVGNASSGTATLSDDVGCPVVVDGDGTGGDMLLHMVMEQSRLDKATTIHEDSPTPTHMNKDKSSTDGTVDSNTFIDDKDNGTQWDSDDDQAIMEYVLRQSSQDMRVVDSGENSNSEWGTPALSSWQENLRPPDLSEVTNSSTVTPNSTIMQGGEGEGDDAGVSGRDRLEMMIEDFSVTRAATSEALLIESGQERLQKLLKAYPSYGCDGDEEEGRTTSSSSGKNRGDSSGSNAIQLVMDESSTRNHETHHQRILPSCSSQEEVVLPMAMPHQTCVEPEAINVVVVHDVEEGGGHASDDDVALSMNVNAMVVVHDEYDGAQEEQHYQIPAPQLSMTPTALYDRQNSLTYPPLSLRSSSTSTSTSLSTTSMTQRPPKAYRLHGSDQKHHMQHQRNSYYSSSGTSSSDDDDDSCNSTSQEFEDCFGKFKLSELDGVVTTMGGKCCTKKTASPSAAPHRGHRNLGSNARPGAYNVVGDRIDPRTIVAGYNNNGRTQTVLSVEQSQDQSNTTGIDGAANGDGDNDSDFSIRLGWKENAISIALAIIIILLLVAMLAAASVILF